MSPGRFASPVFRSRSTDVLASLILYTLIYAYTRGDHALLTQHNEALSTYDFRNFCFFVCLSFPRHNRCPKLSTMLPGQLQDGGRECAGLALMSLVHAGKQRRYKTSSVGRSMHQRRFSDIQCLHLRRVILVILQLSVQLFCLGRRSQQRRQLGQCRECKYNFNIPDDTANITASGHQRGWLIAI